jgi:hypothetical protein
MPRVFCYCRVATERQACKGDTLEVQQVNAKRMLRTLRLRKARGVHVRVLDISPSKAERRG